MSAASNFRDEKVRIEELEIQARIGVTEEERAQPQRLQVNLTVWPLEPFANLRDDIGMAVDYTRLCALVRETAERRTDRLLETLATEMANALLAHFPISRVQIELRKFVLPGAKFSAVMITKEKENRGS